ncbi:MAG TPA: hypothetical protein VFY44_08135, partial [Thermoleophilaceae bacterium]|nr:hypothetical protein [Thermoleophilaceae bacterium]
MRTLGLQRMPGTVVLEQETLAHVASLPEGGWRGQITARDGNVWVLTPDDRKLTRFDAATVAESGEFRLDRGAVGLLVDERGVLVLHADAQVVRLDPVTGAERQRARLPEGTTELVAGPGVLWGLRGHHPGPEGDQSVSLVQVDPSTLGVQREVELGRSIYAGAPYLAEDKVVALIEV